MFFANKHPRPSVAVVALAAALFAGPVAAQEKTQDIKLPSQVAWTAYDVGSAGYNQAVAIGSALKNELGVNLRVLPGKNDVSRQIPLRQRKVDFSATGVGASFMAQEGVFEFGTKDWGPQKVRMLLAANSNVNLTIGTAADANIKTFGDLKGKRVVWVIGSPALNENIGALLYAAGLTWDDVQKVEFPGYGASWEGIINGQADATFGSTNTGPAYQLEASPRGITWPTMRADDTEAWARLKEVAPFFVPNVATVGAGLSEENPNEGPTYPYPILIVYDDQDEDLVYNMTKAMDELFPEYAGKAPGIEGWALDRQIFDWVVPFHEGAIRYFKEAGYWNDELQAHNENLIRRQQVLQEAWDRQMAEHGDADEETFTKSWIETRRQALEEADFNPIYEKAPESG